MVKGTIMEKTGIFEKQYQRLLIFSKKNKLNVNPWRDLEWLANKVLELEHCPCDAKRKKCPCAQSLREIKSQGHCLCWQFLRKDIDYWKEFGYNGILDEFKNKGNAMKSRKEIIKIIKAQRKVDVGIKKSVVDENIAGLKDILDRLEAFRNLHELKTNPSRELIWLARRLIELGHCPADSERKICPCPEALGEIEYEGHCLSWDFLAEGFDYWKEFGFEEVPN